VVVVGLGYDFLFKSRLGHCAELSKALLLNNVDQVEEKKKNEDLNSNTSFTEFNTSISH
jgi:hypothetical protein